MVRVTSLGLREQLLCPRPNILSRCNTYAWINECIYSKQVWLCNGRDECVCFEEMMPYLYWECRPALKANPSCLLECDFTWALTAYHSSYAITPQKEPPMYHLSSFSLHMQIIFLSTLSNKILSSMLSCLNYVFHHYIYSCFNLEIYFSSVAFPTFGLQTILLFI